MFDTIFAPLTIKGKCGLIVVRISGERVDECLEKMGINRKKLKDRGAVLTKIFYRKKILDLGLVLYFKAPRSFTGEDVAELNLHCSDYIVRKVYEMLLEIDGVRLARNGEFSKRAFLNGKMDLVEAESIGDLVNSETELQHGQAIKQLFGKTSEFFESLRNDVLDIQAEVEVMIDFPEDNVGEDFTILEKKVKNLREKICAALSDGRAAEKIKNGLNIAIVGETNVGKSSFLNFLAGEEAAIVSDTAGTTRDVIKIKIELKGLGVNVFDTAGIRDSEDVVEKEGIKRALATAADADLKILILDPTRVLTDKRIKDLADKNTLILVNKADLLEPQDIKNIERALNVENTVLFISVKNNINLDKVTKYMEEYVEKNVLPYAHSGLTQERYRSGLEKVKNCLDSIDFGEMPEIVAENLRAAAFLLGQITGRVGAEAVLEKIFSKFCVGK